MSTDDSFPAVPAIAMAIAAAYLLARIRMNHEKAPSRSGLQESPLAPVGWSAANPPRWALPVVSSAVRQIQRTFRPACRDAGRASFSRS